MGVRWMGKSGWAAVGAAIAVSLGGGGLFMAYAAPSAPSAVVTIDPVRILDTRNPVDVGLAGPFVSPTSQKLQVTGAVPTTTGTATAVPTGATGVLLNVTVTGPSAAGFVSVRPGDATGAPSTSSLNFSANTSIPNSVQVGLPTSGVNAGKIDITYDAFGVSGPTTDILIDVVGYMVEGSAGGTGPAGPAGPQGPQGPQGSTGPAGVSGIQRVEGDPVIVTAGVPFTAIATCPSGKSVLSGGFSVSDNVEDLVGQLTSRPIGTSGWELIGETATTSGQTVTAFAVCAIVNP